MAVNAEEICNKALTRLGIKQLIGVLATDVAAGMEEAVICNMYYTFARDTVLAEFAYMFAQVRKTLVASAEAPWDGWGYAYDPPTSPVVLSPVAVVPPGYAMRGHDRDGNNPYAMVHSGVTDGQLILTDLPAAVMYYVTRITDTTKFPVEFEDAVAWRLAMEISMPLNADIKKASWAKAMYADKVKGAQSATLNNFQSEDAMPEAESVSARS